MRFLSACIWKEKDEPNHTTEREKEKKEDVKKKERKHGSKIRTQKKQSNMRKKRRNNNCGHTLQATRRKGQKVVKRERRKQTYQLP
jgi:hypothetical protein